MLEKCLPEIGKMLILSIVLFLAEKFPSIFDRRCAEYIRDKRAIGKCTHIWSSSTIRNYLFSRWLSVSLFSTSAIKNSSGMKILTFLYFIIDVLHSANASIFFFHISS